MKMRYIIPFIAIFALSALASDGAVSLYNQGNSAYREGDFETAIENYLAAIDTGVADYRVYFNLGNAYFRNNQVGRAILNWERARYLKPRNEDVLENIDFARLTRVDIVLESEGGPKVADVYENTFLGYFYAFLDKFSAVEFRNAIIAFSITATIFLALWLLVRGGFRRFAFWISAAFWTLFTLVLILYGFKQGNIWETDKAIVVQPGTEIRSASYTNSQLLYTFQEGMEVAAIEVRDNYSRIKLRNGEEGWTLSDNIERVLPR